MKNKAGATFLNMKDNTETYNKTIEEQTRKSLLSNLQSISSLSELAAFLNEKPALISYYIYKSDPEHNYFHWRIPKKTSGYRNITSPRRDLKRIQRKINVLFQKIYKRKTNVFGFVKSKGIVDNAKKHLNKEYVVNIDLKDFFPTVHFGRIKGMLKCEPFSLSDNVSRILANLCCYKGTLPQGAPTSPVLTNIICRKLDNDLNRIAKETGATYTRYADDITFSCNNSEFPAGLGTIAPKAKYLPDFKNLSIEISKVLRIKSYKLSTQMEPRLKDTLTIVFENELSQIQTQRINTIASGNKLLFKKKSSDTIILSNRAPEFSISLSDNIVQCVSKNGFVINYNKLRIQTKSYKQEVTGLKVNEKVNVDRRFVRNIRAMLHSWEKYGLEKAAMVCNRKKSIKGDSPKLFLSILQGKLAFLGQVRGKEDQLFVRLKKKFIDMKKANQTINQEHKILLELSKFEGNLINRLVQSESKIIDQTSKYEAILDDIETMKLYIDDITANKGNISKIQDEISVLYEIIQDAERRIKRSTSEQSIKIIAEKFDDSSIRKEIDKIEKGLKKEIVKIQKVLESEIDVKSLDFISDKYANLKNYLQADNILMQRAKVYKDFPRFCGYVWKQFEAIVSQLSKEYNIEKEYVLDDAGKPIFTIQEYQIIFEKLENLKQFIGTYSIKRKHYHDKVFFQYHEINNMFNNKYLVLTDYTKNCRHLAFHGHYINVEQRIIKQNEIELLKFKVNNSDKIKVEYKEKALQLRKDFLILEKYNEVEKILYEFMQLALGNNDND